MKCLLGGYPYQVYMRQVVVDEAQDFTAEEAFFIRDLLIKDKNSKFYIFYDDEQNIYSM